MMNFDLTIRILTEKADVFALLGFWKSNKSCRDYINTRLASISKTLNITTEHAALSFREIVEFMDKKELDDMGIMEGLNHSKIIRSKKGIRMMVKRAEKGLIRDWDIVHFDGNTYTLSLWQAETPLIKFLVNVINERDYGCFGWLSCILESGKNNPLITATNKSNNYPLVTATHKSNNLKKWLTKAVILTDDGDFIEKLNKKWRLANEKSLSYSILLSLKYNLKHFDIFLKKRKELGLISTKSHHEEQGDFDIKLLGFVVHQHPWFTKDIMEFIWCDFDNFYDILSQIRGNSNQRVENMVVGECIKQIKERYSIEVENIRTFITRAATRSRRLESEFIMEYVNRFIKNQNEKLSWDEY